MALGHYVLMALRHDGLMALRQVTDDLGCAMTLVERPSRIVSLVPSLTEAIALTTPQTLVGATEWCTHPQSLSVARVRGTKNPDVRAIRELKPDLVICNQEENRALDVSRLRDAGLAVWVTKIETLDEAFSSLHRLFTVALGGDRPGWLEEAEHEWAAPSAARRIRAAVPIWRDPWMVVGRDTFTGSLLERLGVDNVFGTADSRYPHVSPDDIIAARPDVIVLPDEPYVFTAEDGPEVFPHRTFALVSGRLLTWYGPSLVGAREELGGRLLPSGSNRPT